MFEKSNMIAFLFLLAIGAGFVTFAYFNQPSEEERRQRRHEEVEDILSDMDLGEIMEYTTEYYYDSEIGEYLDCVQEGPDSILNEFSSSYGFDTILDYVRESWSDDEIIEYIQTN